MKNFLAFVFMSVVSASALAGHGVTYELNQGAGYIFQGEMWQASLVVAQFSNRFSTEDSEFSYKVAVRRDITTFDSTVLTGGLSFSQSRPQAKIDYSSNIVSLPVGIRQALSKNLQLDAFVNLASIEERFFYSTASGKSEYISSQTGTRYLGSGGLSVSLFF